jgi:hypothetical protein
MANDFFHVFGKILIHQGGKIARRFKLGNADYILRHKAKYTSSEGFTCAGRNSGFVSKEKSKEIGRKP